MCSREGKGPQLLRVDTMAASVKLLRPDKHGVMERIFTAYSPGGGGVTKAAFLALLSDLGVVGTHADTCVRDSLWEVSERAARHAAAGCQAG